MDWQKSQLAESYKDQMKKRQIQREMERQENHQAAAEYGRAVKAYNDKHDADIRNHQEHSRKMLDKQSNTIIEDANDDKKRKAVNNMAEAYRRQQQLEEQEASRKAQEKRNELSETANILKLQMETKNQKRQANNDHDREFRGFLDKTVNMLNT